MPFPPTTPRASPAQLEKIGELAARMVSNHDRVGLGSGRAALAFVRALGDRIKTEKLHILAVPTSLLTEQAARDAGIPIATLDAVDSLHIAVDGADEVDPNLNLLKGGGGNLTREKVIASISQSLVIVVGEEKIVPRLGTNFPVFVELIEFARPVVTRKLQQLGARVEQRLNPDGSPFLTDNNNPYLHCHFNTNPNTAPSPLHDPAALDLQLHRIPGVVETGLFIHMAEHVLIAHANGEITQQHRPPSH